MSTCRRDIGHRRRGLFGLARDALLPLPPGALLAAALVGAADTMAHARWVSQFLVGLGAGLGAQAPFSADPLIAGWEWLAAAAAAGGTGLYFALRHVGRGSALDGLLLFVMALGEIATSCTACTLLLVAVRDGTPNWTLFASIALIFLCHRQRAVLAAAIGHPPVSSMSEAVVRIALLTADIDQLRAEIATLRHDGREARPVSVTAANLRIAIKTVRRAVVTQVHPDKAGDTALKAAFEHVFKVLNGKLAQMERSS